jgi:hypothetical protein
MTHDELIAALKAATGPSRELDVEVSTAVGSPGRYKPSVGYKCFDAATRRWCSLPRYTGSIDAAVSLYPQDGIPTLIHSNPRFVAMDALRARQVTP